MTTSAPDRPRSTISGPDELLHAIPYLIGFHPDDSLVLVGLEESRVAVTARLDLVAAQDLRRLDHTLGAFAAGAVSGLCAVVYSAAGERSGPALPHTDTITAVTERAEAAGVALVEALLVERDRWWTYLCADAKCCPAEGRVLDAAHSAFAAEATYAGFVALPDRDALARSLDPAPEDEREPLRAPLAAAERAAVGAAVAGHNDRRQRSDKRAIFAAARRADADADAGVSPTLSDDQAIRYAVALTEIAVRDSVWMAVDDRRLDGRALWRELARRLPAPYDAAPLFLYAWSSWRAGNGALAGIAAERAIASDPSYTAADLLIAALSAALDPRKFPKLRSGRAD